ncbi:MAG: LLM class F420-dependent oxidoreductase [Dehalococcoidia bacterium]|nr:LLM class F420-dependent oxidoreductase [Dehalococcoidia bacterium]
MKLGAIFPTNEIGTDPSAIRDYVQAVEEMGYDHLIIYDHVVGADPSVRPGWQGYTIRDAFHEPMATLAFAAAITRRIRLVTAVLILPQRQTVLVAKQAAQIDVLSGGRLTLGVGVGWNPVEYEALNEDFHTRGKRMDEQLVLMRELWTKEVVTFEGQWHKVTAAGLNLLPVQRPIPIWIGGMAEATLRRVATSADGWFPLLPLDDGMRAMLKKLHAFAREAGRDPASIGIEAHVSLRDGDEGYWRTMALGWKEAGATALMVNTMSFSRERAEATRVNFRTVLDHTRALGKARAVLDV